MNEILNAEQVAATRSSMGYGVYWLCDSHEALRAENERLKSMLSALEGDPEAVHQGALAAIEALRQCCGTKARIAELEKERDAALLHQQQSDLRISNQREEVKKLTSDRDTAINRTHLNVKMREEAIAERDALRAAIEAAPHDVRCKSRAVIDDTPWDSFTHPVCRSINGCGHCEKCEWKKDRPQFRHFPCNCWKSRAIAPKERP